jgi:hypothetical protein
MRDGKFWIRDPEKNIPDPQHWMFPTWQVLSTSSSLNSTDSAPGERGEARGAGGERGEETRKGAGGEPTILSTVLMARAARQVSSWYQRGACYYHYSFFTSCINTILDNPLKFGSAKYFTSESKLCLFYLRSNELNPQHFFLIISN